MRADALGVLDRNGHVLTGLGQETPTGNAVGIPVVVAIRNRPRSIKTVSLPLAVGLADHAGEGCSELVSETVRRRLKAVSRLRCAGGPSTAADKKGQETRGGYQGDKAHDSLES